MQRLLQISAVLAIIVGVTHEAKAFGVGADLGYSRIVVKDAEDQSGWGGDLYIRPLPLPIIEPELQLGFHRFSLDNDANFTVYPLMAGARLYIPAVPIFVGAHVGMVGNRLSVPGAGNLPGISDTNWDFGFNVGAGYHFLDLTLVKLGIVLQYYIVPSHDAGAVDFNMLTAGLDVALGF